MAEPMPGVLRNSPIGTCGASARILHRHHYCRRHPLRARHANAGLIAPARPVQVEAALAKLSDRLESLAVLPWVCGRVDT